MVLRIFILYEKQMQTLNTNVKHNFKVDYNKNTEQQILFIVEFQGPLQALSKSLQEIY